MKVVKQFFNVLSTICAVMLLVAFSGFSENSPDAISIGEVPSLSEVLDANGHVIPGVEGSFSGVGYRMAYAENGAPQFIALESAVVEQWSTDFSGANGLSAAVHAIVIDGSDIWVGGNFNNAGGNSSADKVARWDGSSWNALGSGLNNGVTSIAVVGSDVYVGGTFTNAGGDTNADRIARWDGSSWHALGTGVNSKVFSIAASGSDVYVGGSFTDVGGDTNADRIVHWDGSSWSALDTGLNNGVNTILIDGSDVYAGGNFTDAGGVTDADHIARWDGTSWNAIGSGLNGIVRAIAIDGGNMYVGGSFTDAGGVTDADYIARWDGSSWNALGSGLNNTVYAIAISSGEVFIGGYFSDAGGDTDADNITWWDGSTYNPMGTGLNNGVNTIGFSGTTVWAGGAFIETGDAGVQSLYIGAFENIDLPVELTRFLAQNDGDETILSWDTASELNNAGFEIQQFNTANPGASWDVLGWVEGHGTTTVPQSYQYRADALTPGAYRFRLKQIDYDGTFEYSPEVEVFIDLPGSFSLTKPYPNPFTDRFQFSLMVKRTQHVQVRLYNALGQQVDTFYAGELTAETSRPFVVNTTGLPSGLYMVRAEGEHFVASRPVTLAR